MLSSHITASKGCHITKNMPPFYSSKTNARIGGEFAGNSEGSSPGKQNASLVVWPDSPWPFKIGPYISHGIFFNCSIFKLDVYVFTFAAKYFMFPQRSQKYYSVEVGGLVGPFLNMASKLANSAPDKVHAKLGWDPSRSLGDKPNQNPERCLIWLPQQTVTWWMFPPIGPFAFWQGVISAVWPTHLTTNTNLIWTVTPCVVIMQ